MARKGTATAIKVEKKLHWYEIKANDMVFDIQADSVENDCDDCLCLYIGKDCVAMFRIWEYMQIVDRSCKE